ncbi:MAG: DNA polymerase III subunit delta [Thiotrichaceae bacterium]|nr:DNA polymerase III subunit delta [Thiotrichaceae bacterium]
MNIRLAQLEQQLTISECRIFCISGDEPLQMMEATDQVRNYARLRGFDEREIITIEATPNHWNFLLEASVSLSLFSQKKMIDCRMTNCQPGVKGGKVLKEFLARAPDDIILLLQMSKLDARAKKSLWYKQLDQQGVVVQIWDLSASETLAWVAKRMRDCHLQPSQDAVRLLTERNEGNLLAADQEIKKLLLLYGESIISVEQVMASVADSARYSAFDFADAILIGDIQRLHHILQILRQEGSPLTLILWALANLTRQLHNMDRCLQKGGSEVEAFKQAGFIPRPKQKLYPVALRRLRVASWTTILKNSFMLEKMLKGHADTRVCDESRLWDAILDAAILLSGQRLLTTPID